MSRTRHVAPATGVHSGEPEVRSYSVTHPAGSVQLPGAPGWDQLIYAADGAVRVGTPDRVWVIPGRRALWVPRTVRPTVSNRFPAAVRTLYFAGDSAVDTDVRVLELSDVAHALVLHAVDRCPLWLHDDVSAALVTVLMDALRASSTVGLQLPWPTDPLGSRAARALSDDPALSPDAAAALVGVGRRTLERLFARDTGLSLGVWSRRARIFGALDLLASGHTVTATALASGYSTPSSFVAAFTRELGAPPTRYLRHGR